MPVKRDPEGVFWSATDDAQRQVIEDALQANGGNVTHTSRSLDIDRTYLTKLINRLGIANVRRSKGDKMVATGVEQTGVNIRSLSAGGCLVTYWWVTDGENREYLEAAFSTMRKAKSDAADFLTGSGDWKE